MTRLIQAFVACSVVVCAGVATQAAAEPVRGPAASVQARTRSDFARWLHARGERLGIPYPLINSIIVSKDSGYRSDGLLWPGLLTPFIAGDDFVLIRYMDLIETDRKQYGRINAFDRRLLAEIAAYDIQRKRATIDRFERLARDLNIQPAPARGGAEPDASASAAARSETRYNVESGLHEHYDKKLARWVPEALPPPGR